MAFRGHFEHSLDAKNRLSIPARFRAAFSTGTVLAKDFEPCVAVWTADAHEAIVGRALGALNPMGGDYRRLSRYFQAAGEKPMQVGQRAGGKAPGQFGKWLQKPFSTSRKAMQKSGAKGREGRAKVRSGPE